MVAEKTKEGQPVNAVEQAPAQGAGVSPIQVTTPARISMFCLGWTTSMVSADDHEMQVEVD